MAIIGIYKITSPSKKIYIGQSIDIIKRWRSYRNLSCSCQPLLYNSLKKYGANKHKFEILCQCSREELNGLEKYYVDLFNTWDTDYGLNLRDGGGQSASLSESTREKMRLNSIGRKASEETRQKFSEKMKGNTYRRGKKMSEEYVENLRKRMKGNTYTLGYKHSEETLKKMSAANMGRKISDETKRKISDAQKGNTHWLGKKHTEEWKKMMSERNKGQVSWAKGKKFSDEHRRKLSESGKRTRNKVKYAIISQIVQSLTPTK